MVQLVLMAFNVHVLLGTLAFNVMGPKQTLAKMPPSKIWFLFGFWMKIQSVLPTIQEHQEHQEHTLKSTPTKDWKPMANDALF